jgi:hypothetical protein
MRRRLSLLIHLRELRLELDNFLRRLKVTLKFGEFLRRDLSSSDLRKREHAWCGVSSDGDAETPLSLVCGAEKRRGPHSCAHPRSKIAESFDRRLARMVLNAKVL